MPATAFSWPAAARRLLLALSLAPMAAHSAGPIARPYSGTPIDALTYHYDNARTGNNAAETDLTVATVSSAQFGLLQTIEVTGSVLAQPLFVSGFQMPDESVHDILVIATETND